jgi:hypothetical protein
MENTFLLLGIAFPCIYHNFYIRLLLCGDYKASLSFLIDWKWRAIFEVTRLLPLLLLSEVYSSPLWQHSSEWDVFNLSVPSSEIQSLNPRQHKNPIQHHYN